MKVAFVGSHSTGKTTMSHHMREHCTVPVSIIEGIARSIIERGLDFGQYATRDAYVHYIRDQLRAEYDVRDFPGHVISDRCVLDAVAYSSANRVTYSMVLPGFFIEMMREIARYETTFFNHYVYFPVTIPFETDSVRPPDTAYRDLVDRMVVDTLNSLDIEYLTLDGSVEQRAKQLQELGLV